MRQVKPSSVLAEKQLSQLEGTPSTSMLRVYRTARVNSGQVPPHVKIGGRVFYHREDVEHWLKQRSADDSSEPVIFS
jgi:predicted DNA-binding transcriptional regulator AlpA